MVVARVAGLKVAEKVVEVREAEMAVASRVEATVAEEMVAVAREVVARVAEKVVEEREAEMAVVARVGAETEVGMAVVTAAEMAEAVMAAEGRGVVTAAAERAAGEKVAEVTAVAVRAEGKGVRHSHHPHSTLLHADWSPRDIPDYPAIARLR